MLEVAPHTPPHIAALLRQAVGLLHTRLSEKEVLQSTIPIVLCHNLPETLDGGSFYVLLDASGQPRVDAQLICIPTPLSMAQLLHHLWHIVQQQAGLKHLPGGWQLNYYTRQLTHLAKEEGQAQTILALTELEAKLLACLIDHQGTPLSREALMQSVWGYDASIETHTLETHLYRLRQKLDGLTPPPCKIVNENGQLQLLPLV